MNQSLTTKKILQGLTFIQLQEIAYFIPLQNVPADKKELIGILLTYKQETENALKRLGYFKQYPQMALSLQSSTDRMKDKQYLIKLEYLMRTQYEGSEEESQRKQELLQKIKAYLDEIET